jgi:Sir2 family
MLKMLSVKNDEDLREIVQKILKAKKVVVISGLFLIVPLSFQLQQCPAGAGISVAAGLPAFRGAEGLYHAKKSQHCYGYKGNIEDLFSVSSLKASTHTFFT